jgi:hypothetical protein
MAKVASCLGVEYYDSFSFFGDVGGCDGYQRELYLRGAPACIVGFDGGAKVAQEEGLASFI